MKTYTCALTIAGSDSGGGAGIQADLKTFSALGCFGTSVITAVTAQNTMTVSDIHPIPTEIIKAQCLAVLNDIGTDAIKIGMLHSSQVIETVVAILKEKKSKNIVVDPVMIAKSGDKLLEDEAIYSLKTLLFPIATLITPNLPEVCVLLGLDKNALNNSNTQERMQACIELAALKASNILLKGGHLNSAISTDILYIAEQNKFYYFDTNKIISNNTHGTGCTLSSAITAFLAKGDELPIAVSKAKDFVTNALVAGADFTIGKGHGPIHHFHKFWIDS